jgi:PAS domain S-box-containing protein
MATEDKAPALNRLETGSVISFDLSRREGNDTAENAEAVGWLKNFFENSSVAVAYFDKLLHCRYINPAFSQFTSLKSELAQNKSLWTILPGLAPRLDLRLRSILENNAPMSQEELIVAGATPQTPSRYVMASAQPVRPHGKEPTGVLLQFIDITNRKSSERKISSLNLLLNDRLTQVITALKTASSQSEILTTVLKSTHEGLIVCCEDGKGIVNPTARELLGLPAGFGTEMTEYSRLDLWITDNYSSLFSVKEVSTGRLCTTREVLFHRGLQPPIWLSVQTFPLVASDCKGGIVLLKDISERKKQEELALQGTVELRRSNESLTHFAQIASHDLKEPLRTVTLFTELAQGSLHGGKEEETDRYLSYVRNGVQRMDALLEGLRTYSSVGSSKHYDDLISFKEIVDQACQNLEVTIRETGAQITTVEPLPEILGNSVELIQTVQNLLSNAIKFRRDITPVIKISCEPMRHQWLIRIEDNGIGIPESQRKHVFQMFHRLHPKDFSGTGVGLTVCQRVIENHGGKIWMEPSSLGGNCASFTLPKEPEESSAHRFH